MNKRSLLIVANHSIARLFEVKKPGNHLTELRTLHNEQGRAHKQDLVTDRPGIMSQGSAQVKGRDAMAPAQDPTTHILEMFAAEVAELANDARRKSQLDSLDIIAESGFLGALRKKLDKQTMQLVSHSINKDVVDKDEKRLRELLQNDKYFK